MFTIKRLAIFLALAIMLSTTLSAYAQGSEPTAIIDAALRDLSQKLGRTLTRNNVDTYSWEQINFPDASLGCPQPGQMYAQVVTLGYKLSFTVNNVVYDYRARNDGSQLFQCSASGAVPVAPTPTRETAPPTVRSG